MESPTPEPTETVGYSQTNNETISIEGGTGFAIRIQIPESFILQWTVENESSTDLDFDVFLFTESGYREYLEVVRGESGDPTYIVGGTVQDIETSARATVTMKGGRYRLVVDNSDIGDAGDSGAERTRKVSIKYSMRKA
jgi:predicted patatin/cPLA2 family phospholipase